MGKFGGIELNYSSDIDVVFFYGEEGYLNPRFSYREFFTRLAEEIIQIFSATAEPLFRIDVRLRPEGAHGPLVRPLASMENSQNNNSSKASTVITKIYRRSIG
jgi:glutamate-ammonia-ligase adenylyltransferase